jgi:uncharacterized protein (TIGR02271 family)
MTINTSDVAQLRGLQLIDRDGSKVGKIDEIYLDEQTGQPEWLAVNTGLFGSNVSFVPLAQATNEGDQVRVPYEKSQIKDAPNASADGQLSQEEEQRLYSHYGLEYGEHHSDSGLAEGGTGRFDESTTRSTDTSTSGFTGTGTEGGTVGHDTSGPTTDQAMTRSEEELKVGTAKREAGRARLRKYVVTENVTQTVPVQREEVRVEREPITDANVGRATDGPAISEEEHEVVLHEETPVVEKQAVPKERVRLDVDTHTEERQVSEDVRSEQIEVDGDETSTRRGDNR